MRLFNLMFNKNKSTDKQRREEYYLGKELIAKARIFLEMEEYSKALPLLDKAIELEQKEGYYIRGLCLQALEFNLDAIDDFTKTISMAPNDCNLYFCRGNSEINLNQYDSAIEDGAKAVQLAEAGFVDNKRYDEAAIAQGSSSASSVYSAMIGTWKIMQGDPKIQKLLQDRFKQRLESSLPEDIAYIKEEQRKKDELFKRRIK